MCEFSAKLIAWLDHELPADEAAGLARHVRACAECRRNFELYERASSAFEAYCDALVTAKTASKTGRRLSRQLRVLSPALSVAAALIAAAFALQLLIPHTPAGRHLPGSVGLQGNPIPLVGAASGLPKQTPEHLGFPSVGEPEKSRLHPQAATAPAASVLEKAFAPVNRVRHQHPAEREQRPDTSWPPDEPAIQIAIPADAVFPPGAVPEGVNFIADINIAADGAVQQLRLRPRLTGFERRMTQP